MTRDNGYDGGAFRPANGAFHVVQNSIDLCHRYTNRFAKWMGDSNLTLELSRYISQVFCI